MVQTNRSAAGRGAEGEGRGVEGEGKARGGRRGAKGDWRWPARRDRWPWPARRNCWWWSARRESLARRDRLAVSAVGGEPPPGRDRDWASEVVGQAPAGGFLEQPCLACQVLTVATADLEPPFFHESRNDQGQTVPRCSHQSP